MVVFWNDARHSILPYVSIWPVVIFLFCIKQNQAVSLGETSYSEQIQWESNKNAVCGCFNIYFGTW